MEKLEPEKRKRRYLERINLKEDTKENAEEKKELADLLEYMGGSDLNYGFEIPDLKQEKKDE